MPSVTLHLVLADRVLDHWKARPTSAPFDPSSSPLLNAFYQGAVGPDLGYFPGGYRFLSDLSHLVKTGDLTRTLVEKARTPLERAFAWGWVTHVLADQAIHPLIGQGVGEIEYGDREIFAESALHETRHVQVETGLDALYSQRFPGLRFRKMTPVFSGSSIGFLVGAYEKVYGVPVDPSLFLVSHMAATRMSVRGLFAAGVLSTTFLSRPGSATLAQARRLLHGMLTGLQKWIGRNSLALAYLNPISPADWLVEEVEAVLHEFAPRFLLHFEGQCRELANFNLDSGQVEEPGTTHLGARRAMAKLDGRAIPA